MRAAVLAAGVLLLLAVDSEPLGAQFRNGGGMAPAAPAPPPPSVRGFTSTLTFRPRTPDASRQPLPWPHGLSQPLRGVPLWWWWRWDVAMRTEAASLTTPPTGDAIPTGGVQLDIVPWRSQVYVDGVYAGVVEDFRGYYHHLDLAAGPHVLTIVMTGYAPHTFDVVVVPGRTVTYRASLSR